MPDAQPRNASPPDPALVADAFGLGPPIGRPSVAARGELGRIWRLETERGPWAVKELLRYDEDRVRDDAKADLAFQLAALDAGVPMPRPIVARTGDAIVDVGPAGSPRLVRLYSWVDLAGRDVSPAVEDVAAILGRLHALAHRDGRDRHPWYATPPAAERWPGLVAEAKRAGGPWVGDLVRVVPIVLELLEATPPERPVPLVSCHLDYNPENVLVDAGGRPVVVDWENSGPAAPEQELASVVAEFVADPRDVAAFIGAYEAAGGTGRLVDRSSFRMTAVVQANLVETYGRIAASDAAAPEDAARSAHWVVDIARNAFSLARVDAWLEAAAATAR